MVAEAGAGQQVLDRAAVIELEIKIDLGPFFVVSLGIAGDFTEEVARAGSAEVHAVGNIGGGRVETGHTGDGKRGLASGLGEIRIGEDEILGKELMLGAAGCTRITEIGLNIEIIGLVVDFGVVILGLDFRSAIKRIDDERGGIDRIFAQHAASNGGIGDIGQAGPIVAGEDIV